MTARKKKPAPIGAYQFFLGVVYDPENRTDVRISSKDEDDCLYLEMVVQGSQLPWLIEKLQEAHRAIAGEEYDS